MVEDSLKLPSDLALERLRQKVDGDATLSDAIKAAFLEDLDGNNVPALTKLKAAIAGEGQSHEAGKSQSQ